MNLKHVLVGCATLGMLLAAPVKAEDHGAAPLTDSTLHDNFNAKRLNPEKWFGEQKSTGGPGGLEILRRVNRKGHLVMRHRVSGLKSDDGGRHISRNRLRMVTDDPISGMQFDTRVNHLRLSACEEEGASKAAAKLRGAMFLFNDGSRTGANDARGDMGAVIEIYRDTQSEGPKHEYSVRGFVFRCTSWGCGSSSIVEQVDLGTVRRRQVVTLGMEWDGENTVSFWKDGEEMSASFHQENMGDSTLMNNRLEVRVEGANCMTGESFAEMKALFDNVHVLN